MEKSYYIKLFVFKLHANNLWLDFDFLLGENDLDLT